MAAALLSVLSGRIRRWKYIRICGGGEADSRESGKEMQNPEKHSTIPKNTRKEMNILPEALIGPYLSAAKEHGILAPMYLELTTGLTVREIAAALGMSKSAVQRRIDHIGNRVRLLASA